LRGLRQFLHWALSVLHVFAAALSVAFESRATLPLGEEGQPEATGSAAS